MTNLTIATTRNGDTAGEVRKALSALAVLQIVDMVLVPQPDGDVKLQVPDARAEEAFTVLRRVGILARRTR
jgi:hypothetical protein